jgi:CSLREA domain-containing protein
MRRLPGLRIATSSATIAAVLVVLLAMESTVRAATITVDTLADGSVSGSCTLRDAITAANTNVAVNACAGGTGVDTIMFSRFGTITLGSVLPQVTRNLTITGPPRSLSGILHHPETMIISGNNAVDVMSVGPGATLTLNNLNIVDAACPGCEVANAAILNLGGGTLNVNDCNFDSNQGAINSSNGSTLTVTDSQFSNDDLGGVTGAIANDGAMTVNNSAFSDNHGIIGAGAIYTQSCGGQVTISNSTFSGNSSFLGSGGAIFNGGSCPDSVGAGLDVVDSTFTGNIAVDSEQAAGGAIANAGYLTVVGSTFEGNQGGEGGAIGNSGGLTVVNSTFFGNNALGIFLPFGGGIATLGGTVTVTFSTFDHNTAPFGGGGIANIQGIVTVRSTLLANNNSGDCFNYPGTAIDIVDNDFNFADDATCGFAGDNVNPDLDPSGLQNNGGPTQTVALDKGSPAIDGIPVADCTDQDGNKVTADQRGYCRPAGDGCDSGAYEFHSHFPLPIFGCSGHQFPHLPGSPR